MSADKMREEFEAAYLEEINEGGDSVSMNDIKNSRVEDTYSVPIMAGAWWAWQASRAALVIELPAQLSASELPLSPCDWKNGGSEMRARCWNAIEAAGVKVKP